ncbi:S8 family serine peptidase [Natrinema sp. SYSU A 869]|uniref:S8 family peptidase n=1 Tax=Natrinema sp. SYSU A 869 TaxID=2871694 RepID=UPI001CA41EAF|nr:S8 family serine peptidase [Natrinema sp. SYSU A 869]
MIDASDISERTRERIDIVHDLPELDLVVGYVAPELVETSATFRDSRSSFGPEIRTRVTGTFDVSGEDLYELQWDKQSQSVRECHEETRGDGVTIGIVGTGVIDNHPDLASALNGGRSRNVTEDAGDHTPIGGRSHATHVTGIIAGTGRDGGVTGVAPGVEVRDYRVTTRHGVLAGDLLAALAYAVEDGCDVVNVSQNWYPYTPESDHDVLLDALQRVAARAETEGTIVVCSAGNDAKRLSPEAPPFALPTNVESFVTVSATAPAGYNWPATSSNEAVGGYSVDPSSAIDEPAYTPTTYTNYGRETVTVSAPGGEIDETALNRHPGARYDGILSTTFSYRPNSSSEKRVPEYGWADGTSLAAPQVTGALALLRSKNPALGPEAARLRLRETAREIDPLQYRGAGHLDLKSLLSVQ